MNKGGFSWNRFLGISRAKQKLSRQIGIPLTKSGRQRKLGSMLTGKGCMLILFFWLITSISIVSLSCNEESTSASGDCERVGAICNDGTSSSATGSGACSSHGGVKEWKCK